MKNVKNVKNVRSLRKRHAIKKGIHLPKRTKRYNGVYDPEFEPAAEAMLSNEMTGAVPAAPKTEYEEEALEDLSQGVRFE